MTKAVIFDMDGLLINSEPFWQEVESQIFSGIGVPLTKEMTTQTMGMRVDEVVEYWYARYPWKTPSKKEVEVAIIKGVVSLIKEKGEALSGVLKTLKLVAGQNLPIAIASSSYMEIINAAVEKIGIEQYINIIHSSEHEPYGKPHPGVYLTTAEKLGVSPDTCLVFEDSPNGVLAAKAAKMKCIAIPNPAIKSSKVFDISDLILNSLDDFSLKVLNEF